MPPKRPGSARWYVGWRRLAGVDPGAKDADSLRARPCPPVRLPAADQKGLLRKEFRRRARRTSRPDLSAWSAGPADSAELWARYLPMNRAPKAAAFVDTNPSSEMDSITSAG